MNFPDELTRVRSRKVADPYNPDALVDDPTGVMDRITIYGFLDSETSAEITSTSREEVTSGATLYLEDVTLDVQRGDIIEMGDRTWTVAGFPPAPRNPFTGWQPYRVCNLEEVRG